MLLEHHLIKEWNISEGVGYCVVAFVTNDLHLQM